jgi:hypothetical protein
VAYQYLVKFGPEARGPGSITMQLGPENSTGSSKLDGRPQFSEVNFSGLPGLGDLRGSNLEAGSLLTGGFGNLGWDGPSDYGHSENAQTQQSKRPFSFAKSESTTWPSQRPTKKGKGQGEQLQQTGVRPLVMMMISQQKRPVEIFKGYLIKRPLLTLQDSEKGRPKTFFSPPIWTLTEDLAFAAAEEKRPNFTSIPSALTDEDQKTFRAPSPINADELQEEGFSTRLRVVVRKKPSAAAFEHQQPSVFQNRPKWTPIREQTTRRRPTADTSKYQLSKAKVPLLRIIKSRQLCWPFQSSECTPPPPPPPPPLVFTTKRPKTFLMTFEHFPEAATTNNLKLPSGLYPSRPSSSYLPPKDTYLPPEATNKPVATTIFIDENDDDKANKDFFKPPDFGLGFNSTPTAATSIPLHPKKVDNTTEISTIKPPTTEISSTEDTAEISTLKPTDIGTAETTAEISTETLEISTKPTDIISTETTEIGTETTEIGTKPTDISTETAEISTETAEINTKPTTESNTKPTEISTTTTTIPTEISTKPFEINTRPTSGINTIPTEISTTPTVQSFKPTRISTKPTETSTKPTESSTKPTKTSTKPPESSTKPTKTSTGRPTNISSSSKPTEINSTRPSEISTNAPTTEINTTPTTEKITTKPTAATNFEAENEDGNKIDLNTEVTPSENNESEIGEEASLSFATILFEAVGKFAAAAAGTGLPNQPVAVKPAKFTPPTTYPEADFEVDGRTSQIVPKTTNGKVADNNIEGENFDGQTSKATIIKTLMPPLVKQMPNVSKMDSEKGTTTTTTMHSVDDFFASAAVDFDAPTEKVDAPTEEVDDILLVDFEVPVDSEKDLVVTSTMTSVDFVAFAVDFDAPVDSNAPAEQVETLVDFDPMEDFEVPINSAESIDPEEDFDASVNFEPSVDFEVPVDLDPLIDSANPTDYVDPEDYVDLANPVVSVNDYFDIPVVSLNAFDPLADSVNPVTNLNTTNVKNERGSVDLSVNMQVFENPDFAIFETVVVDESAITSKLPSDSKTVLAEPSFEIDNDRTFPNGTEPNPRTMDLEPLFGIEDIPDPAVLSPPADSTEISISEVNNELVTKNLSTTTTTARPSPLDIGSINDSIDKVLESPPDSVADPEFSIFLDSLFTQLKEATKSPISFSDLLFVSLNETLQTMSLDERQKFSTLLFKNLQQKPNQ